MLVSLVSATAAALAPAPLAKLAIDDGIQKHDVGNLDLIVVAFLVSAVVYAVASYGQTYLVGWVGQRALQDLRVKLFTHLQQLSIGFYSRNRAGVIISRLTNDVEALDQLVEDGMATLIQSGLTLIGVLAILFVLDAHLGAADLLGPAASGRGRPRVPDRLGGRIPADAREDRDDHRHTCRRRCSGSAWSGCSVRSPGTSNTSANSTRRTGTRQHDHGQAERGLLPGGRVPLRARDGRDPACAAGSRSSPGMPLPGSCSPLSPHSTTSSIRSSSSHSSTRPTSRAWRRWTRSSSFSTRCPS